MQQTGFRPFIDAESVFCGIVNSTVLRNSTMLRLTQTSYIKSILDRFEMLECKHVLTPMLESTLLINRSPRTEEEASVMKNVPYREFYRLALYLAVMTRPGIAVAVSILAKHVQEPRPLHWQGLKRVIRYPKGTMSHGLKYAATTGNGTAVSSNWDADWSTDPKDRRSRIAVVYSLGSNVVSWTSRKQQTPSVSSFEFEYVVLFTAVRDAV
jgi:hypothetical protein